MNNRRAYLIVAAMLTLMVLAATSMPANAACAAGITTNSTIQTPHDAYIAAYNRMMNDRNLWNPPKIEGSVLDCGNYGYAGFVTDPDTGAVTDIHGYRAMTDFVSDCAAGSVFTQTYSGGSAPSSDCGVSAAGAFCGANKVDEHFNSSGVGWATFETTGEECTPDGLPDGTNAEETPDNCTLPDGSQDASCMCVELSLDCNGDGGPDTWPDYPDSPSNPDAPPPDDGSGGTDPPPDPPPDPTNPGPGTGGGGDSGSDGSGDDPGAGGGDTGGEDGAGGGGTGFGGPAGDGDGSCDPATEECGDGEEGGESGGPRCDERPVCEDTGSIQCAQLFQDWRFSCSPSDTGQALVEQQTQLNEALDNLKTQLFENPASTIEAPTLDRSGYVAAGCPSDRTINVLGASMSFPFGPLCSLASIIGILVVISAAITSTIIIIRSF